MTEPTINLQKDLELWGDFTSRYYNNQRSLFKDKSGYGRSFFTQGAVTVGIDGPADFDALQWVDGDRVLVRNPVTFESGEPWTMFANVNINNDEIHTSIMGRQTAFENAQLSFRDSRLVWSANDGEGRFNGPSFDRFTWGLVWVTHLGNKEMQMGKIQNGDYGVTNFTVKNTSKQPVEALNSDIAGINSSRAKCAFAGAYRRMLSKAELLYLSQLTEPRRAQL